MRTQTSSQKKPMNMVRIIKTPVKAICKVLDLYVKGVTSFSNTYNRPLRYMVEVTRTSQQLPRSFTTGSLSDKDQPPEGALVRSISTGTIDNKAANIKITNLELYMIHYHRQQVAQLTVSRKLGMPRSCVVEMGKIDEDRVSSFRDDNIVLKNKLDGISFEDDSVSSKMSTKRSLFACEAMVSIDMPAGPSEVLVIADKYASPVHIAADLLSQAEHGPDSQVVLVIASEGVDIKAIDEEITKQCDSLPRGEFASKALSHSFTVFARDMVEVILDIKGYNRSALDLISCQGDA